MNNVAEQNISDELRAGIAAFDARVVALGGYGIRIAATMPDGVTRTGVLTEGASCQPWLTDETNGKRYLVRLDEVRVLAHVPVPPGGPEHGREGGFPGHPEDA